jgi:hypothetical protein
MRCDALELGQDKKLFSQSDRRRGEFPFDILRKLPQACFTQSINLVLHIGKPPIKVSVALQAG